MNIYDLLNLNMSGISNMINDDGIEWILNHSVYLFLIAKECLFQSDSSVYNCK